MHTDESMISLICLFRLFCLFRGVIRERILEFRSQSHALEAVLVKPLSRSRPFRKIRIQVRAKLLESYFVVRHLLTRPYVEHFHPLQDTNQVLDVFVPEKDLCKDIGFHFQGLPSYTLRMHNSHTRTASRRKGTRCVAQQESTELWWGFRDGLRWDASREHQAHVELRLKWEMDNFFDSHRCTLSVLPGQGCVGVSSTRVPRLLRCYFRPFFFLRP